MVILFPRQLLVERLSLINRDRRGRATESKLCRIFRVTNGSTKYKRVRRHESMEHKIRCTRALSGSGKGSVSPDRSVGGIRLQARAITATATFNRKRGKKQG